MKRLFNSTKEVKLRVLLLLDETTIYPLNEDMILAMDFIVVYGKDFGLSNTNLHGDNSYKYSELASRKEMIKQSIKELFLDGLIGLDTSKGYRFYINDAGSSYISDIDNDYSDEYRQNVISFCKKYGNYSAGKLLKMIQENSKVVNEEEL